MASWLPSSADYSERDFPGNRVVSPDRHDVEHVRVAGISIGEYERVDAVEERNTDCGCVTMRLAPQRVRQPARDSSPDTYVDAARPRREVAEVAAVVPAIEAGGDRANAIEEARRRQGRYVSARAFWAAIFDDCIDLPMSWRGIVVVVFDAHSWGAATCGTTVACAVSCCFPRGKCPADPREIATHDARRSPGRAMSGCHPSAPRRGERKAYYEHHENDPPQTASKAIQGERTPGWASVPE
jgi:hypothetical protein